VSLPSYKVAETHSSAGLARLRSFVVQFEQLVGRAPKESDLLREGAALLGDLVRTDDWLPARYAEPAADRYRQYLLYLDPAERFSVVSFVWGPGQTTPIHDHTVWGLIGMLRGSETEQHYTRLSDGTLAPEGEPHRLLPGAVDAVSPRMGDLHRVSNAYEDRTSISIHVYGANIGAVERAVYQPDGTRTNFISGYSNQDLPNLWDDPGNPQRNSL
jgi:predicted metal-dependent enzyme (double-stranded beta helix superfamily)